MEGMSYTSHADIHFDYNLGWTIMKIYKYTHNYIYIYNIIIINNNYITCMIVGRVYIWFGIYYITVISI